MIALFWNGDRKTSGAVASATPRHRGEAERSVRGMATLTSVDAVRRKIQTLQQAAYEAEDRAELLQGEADMEREARGRVTPETLLSYCQ